jgi:hypothetical protein
MNGPEDRDRLDLALRRVLGFDVRVGLSKLLNVYGPQHGAEGSRLSRGICRLTMDPELWPSVVKRDEDRDLPQLNGYNLYSELSANVLEGITQEDQSLRAAFDIAASSYASLQGTFGMGWNRLDATSQQLLEEGWMLLGFDVVDPRTQLSGLHSFELSPAELAQLEVTVRPAISEFGLVANLRSAEASASLLDGIVPEHAPFCACGIWVATA